MKLYEHQKKALESTKDFNKCAYYLDMGLGKTITSIEKMKELNAYINVIICQKSLMKQWADQIKESCPDYELIDGTKVKDKVNIITKCVILINYDLVFRRDWLKKLYGFTLILDESSMIQNKKAKRTKTILALKYSNVILLSGTPVSGKYENLISQCNMLGWNISKKAFYERYIRTIQFDIGGFPVEKVVGYKNVDELKSNLRSYGAVFMKSEEVINLPEQIETTIEVDTITEYRKFIKHSIVNVDNVDIVGNNSLTKLLYSRQLCTTYNRHKLSAFCDLIESTNDRLIVFYNFNSELEKMLEVTGDRPISVVNGSTRDLDAYNEHDNSITFIHYQAGSMGLNLQKANKIVYFSLPLSSELFEQSKKRTHRIGQTKTCFYYYLVCKNSVEEKILETLKMRKDYTDALFKENF